jgi:uncharacterized repeat protein (TIGR03803 family)
LKIKQIKPLLIVFVVALLFYGARAQTFTTLYSFDGTHGANPQGSLTFSRDGSTLYGMTPNGGTSHGTSTSHGTIFSISTNGGIPTILWSFKEGSDDPQVPFGDLTLSRDGSTLYGMTSTGGYADYKNGPEHPGAIFSISTNGTGFTKLFGFDGIHGYGPRGSLTLSQDGSTLYGMIGEDNEGVGNGNIFSISTNGGTPTILFDFDDFDGNYGANPQGNLTLSRDGSTLYGMTLKGGVNLVGTIFSISTDGTGFTKLFDFNSANDTVGNSPRGSLMLSQDGSTLYGMTTHGGTGTFSSGNVFSISTNGGTPTSLCPVNEGDNFSGFNSLTLVGSTLYGMTAEGGTNYYGSIFSIPVTGGGTPTIVFNLDDTTGCGPYGSLTLSPHGLTLYGMTSSCGGNNNYGTVFKVKLQGIAPPTGSIAAGRKHTLALKPDGTLLAGGSGGNGQIGDGTTHLHTSLVSVSGVSNIVGIAAGELFSYAWMADGTAWALAWGDNRNGEMGNGTTAHQQTSAAQINNLYGVVDMSAGNHHGLAVDTNGWVWAWGLNNFGQVGANIVVTDRLNPMPIPNFSGVVAVAAGSYHSLALKTNGTVWGWGRAKQGELGDGSTPALRTIPVKATGLTNVSAIAAGMDFSLAISNGFVWQWGGVHQPRYTGYPCLLSQSSTPVMVTVHDPPAGNPPLTNIEAIAAGWYHVLALKSDGTVWSWGFNGHGQLGGGGVMHATLASKVYGLSNVVAIAAGGEHSVALKSDGTIALWGYINYGQELYDSYVPIIPEPNVNLFQTSP